MFPDCFYVSFLWRLVCFESEKAEIYFFPHLCDLTQGQSITCFHSFGVKACYLETEAKEEQKSRDEGCVGSLMTGATGNLLIYDTEVGI